MSEPAAKRRRMSQGSSSQHDSTGYMQSAPATPTRASYRAPTKSSLQRSHPHLASRGNELLKRVMSGVPATEKPQGTNAESGEIVEALEDDDLLQTGSGDTVRQSMVFETPPITQLKPRSSTETDGRPTPNDFAFTKVPRLVSSSQSRRRELSLSPDNSLPPTPVELGISAPPEPPRGLSSSSPRGSRSGGGSNRLRRRGSRSVTGSPLRLKSHNIQSNRAVHEKADMAEEVPESGMGDAEPVQSDDMPEQLREKHATLKRLKARARQLRVQSRQLETAMRSNDILQAIKSDLSFVDLLKVAGKASTQHDSTFNLKPADTSEKKQLLHLNLFAPSNLRLEYDTVTRIVNQRAKVVHDLKLHAPEPWPPHVFRTDFQVIIDAEDIRVESIKYSDVNQTKGISNELYSWIKTRLGDDLVRTDLNGLVCGLGNYFASSIHRAQLFHNLTAKYGETLHKDLDIDEVFVPAPFLKLGNALPLSAEQAIHLSEYLNDSQLDLYLPSPHVDVAKSNTSSSSEDGPHRTHKSRPKILVVWNIALGLTSTASNRCDLVLSGVSDAAQRASRKIFHRLARVQGYERAFEAVWEVLNSPEAQDEPGNISETVKDGWPRKKGGVGGKMRRKRRFV